MRKVWLAVLVLAAVAFLAVPGFAADEVFDRVLPLPAGGSLVLENVTGSVTIVGWDRQDVEVHAVKSAVLAEDLGMVQIDAAAASGRVAVKTVYPKDDSAQVIVNYTVRVPRHVWLEQVATVNGTVRVSGLQGAGELRSVNGDVEVSDSSGGFSAHTTNGDIHMELSRLAAKGPLTMETVNGSIGLAMPAGTPAALDIRCMNGSFHSDLPMSVVGAYTPREFQGRLGVGGAAVRLRTVNGAIRIQVLGQGV
jgi:DUF4097 and DUF4098 domain-containing protein YvlB